MVMPSYCSRAPRAALRGFTLIELLVVIAILAILAAILFPVAKSMLASGQTGKAVSNLRQIGVLVASYAAENNNRLPPLRIGWNIGSSPDNYVFFQNLLRKNAALPYNAKNFRADDVWLPEIFYDPVVKKGQQHLWGCFGANDAIVLPDAANGTPLSSIGSPSEKVVAASAADRPGGRFKSSWLIYGREYASQGEASNFPKPDARHGGKALCLFADGHTERLDTINMSASDRRKYFLPDAE